MHKNRDEIINSIMSKVSPIVKNALAEAIIDVKDVKGMKKYVASNFRGNCNVEVVAKDRVEAHQKIRERINALDTNKMLDWFDFDVDEVNVETSKIAQNEGWVTNPVMNSTGVFNEIVRNLTREELWNIFSKNGSSTPEEYFTDLLRDNYLLTVHQVIDILAKLKAHYNLPYFDDYDKEKYANTINVLSRQYAVEEVNIVPFGKSDEDVDIFRIIDADSDAYLIFGDRKIVRKLFNEDLKNDNADKDSLKRFGNFFYSYICYSI